MPELLRGPGRGGQGALARRLFTQAVPTRWTLGGGWVGVERRHGPGLLLLILFAAGTILLALRPAAGEPWTDEAYARALLAPIAPIAPIASIAPVAPVASIAPVAPIAPIAPVAPVAPGSAWTVQRSRDPLVLLARADPREKEDGRA